jgi:hypothetical protein
MNLKRPILAAVLLATLVAGPKAGTAAPANNDVIPLIEMENTPLPDAIRQLARQAHLNVVIDPRLSQPPLALLKVSIRWQNVTAKEALLAVLENYGLVLVQR